MKNKAQTESQVIIWIVVLVVVGIVIISLSRVNMATWFKNLPGAGFQDEDEEIDLPANFNCDYPIGYIPFKDGRRTIHLLDWENIKKVNLEDVEGQLGKAKERPYLQLTGDGEILYSERSGKWWNLWLWKEETDVANKINVLEEGKKTNENIIKFNQKLEEFTYNTYTDYNLGIKNPIVDLIDLREDLRLLYNSKYISNLGWLCGDYSSIQKIGYLEECKETCEIYGGSCKDRGDNKEIELIDLDCEINKKCFINLGEKLETSGIKVKEISFSKDQHDRKFSRYISLIGIDNISLNDLKQGAYEINFSFQGPENLACLFIRNRTTGINEIALLSKEKDFVLGRGYKDSKIDYILKTNKDIYLDSMEELFFSIYFPSSGEFIYKNINVTSTEEFYQMNEIIKKLKLLKNMQEFSIQTGSFRQKIDVTDTRDKSTLMVDQISPKGFIFKKVYYSALNFWKPRIEVSVVFTTDIPGRSGISAHLLDCNINSLWRGILLKDLEKFNEKSLEEFLKNCSW